mmetsp:Transcript_8629/g.14350  ORF Transcript_8629/g.14350 Transcript_8629/m.14350 type:complete len:204 (-) Transcript_8629:1217-1828(-)
MDQNPVDSKQQRVEDTCRSPSALVLFDAGSTAWDTFDESLNHNGPVGSRHIAGSCLRKEPIAHLYSRRKLQTVVPNHCIPTVGHCTCRRMMVVRMRIHPQDVVGFHWMHSISSTCFVECHRCEVSLSHVLLVDPIADAAEDHAVYFVSYFPSSPHSWILALDHSSCSRAPPPWLVGIAHQSDVAAADFPHHQVPPVASRLDWK